MPSRTVVFFLESWLLLAAVTMMILRRRKLFTCRRIMVYVTILLTAYPAPCATTASSHVKLIVEIHATREDIVTCRILEGPSLTPRALLRIR
jgi:hypothetical protein